MSKPRIAPTSLCGCFGCHMSLLDIDERILKLAGIVEFARSPINDWKRIEGRCAGGLIEGGCASADNVEVLRHFREHCDVLVSVGDCATTGGIPALRNMVGDEFVILLPCTERAEAVAIAESIRLETAAHVFLDRAWGVNEAPLHLGGIITASIGVSTLRTTPDADCGPGDQNRLAVRLLQNADRALYQAKTTGKNRVTYIPTDSTE